MDLEDFARAIAEIEGLDLDDAREMVRLEAAAIERGEGHDHPWTAILADAIRKRRE